MKRKILFVVVMTFILSVFLSSCAVNVFQTIDKPKNISDAAESALEAANNGDTQVAANLSAQVISQVASGTTTPSPNLYEALSSSATSSQSKETINEIASQVEKVKMKIENGAISQNSTTGIAVKNAAIAMIRSVSQAKKIDLSDVASKLLNVLISSSQYQTHARVFNAADSSTFEATTASKIVELLLSITIDTPTMNLMSNLCDLVSVYGGDEAFNWDVSATIYDVWYSATALFDSNEDGVLNTSDEIFKYVWDAKNKKFKDPSQINWTEVMNLKLATYNNEALSQNVMEKLSQALSKARDALKHVPPSLNVNVSETNVFLDSLSTIYDKLNAQEIASFETLEDLLTFLQNSFH